MCTLRGVTPALSMRKTNTKRTEDVTFHPLLVALNAADLEGYRALKADLAGRNVKLSDARPEDIEHIDKIAVREWQTS